MEDGKITKAEHSEDSVFSDSDLTSQLRDKIRTQAQRLRSLEHYRILCEHRIQELVPGHNIPVRQTDLGTGPIKSNELQLAKEKISRLEKQLSSQKIESEESQDPHDYNLLLEKYNYLLLDKRDLEESLRAEMLNSEEQRTYIEYLKISLENDDYDAITIEHKGSVTMNCSQGKIDDSKREVIRLKNTIGDYESHVKRLQGLVRSKDSEIERFAEDRRELDKHLRQAAEALHIAEEEVLKHETEKETLLECIELHTLKEKDMEKELDRLSKDLEKMKFNLHETLQSLETHKSTQFLQEAESELLKESLNKSAISINDQNFIIEKLKKNLLEKENDYKTVKELKDDAEIKIERLQANIESLSESLNDTQIQAKHLKGHIDEFSKQNSQKIEKITEKFEDQLKNIENALDAEKKTRCELEQIHENDSKQIQEFKYKIMDLQAKCEIFENIKRSRSDYEYSKKIDNSRIGQLEGEIIYLQETCKESEHRESIQVQTINDLRGKISELEAELEDVYTDLEKAQIEVKKYSKTSELLSSKFQHLSNFCETLELDKSELEKLLKTEKNLTKALQGQVSQDKSLIESLEKSLSEHMKSTEKFERFSKEKETENKTLKQQFKLSERETEEEKQGKLKFASALQEMSNKLAVKDQEIEGINIEIINCCKLISAFCGKCTITYNDYRSCLSSTYKTYLETWKEGSGTNMENLKSWTLQTIEEVQILCKHLFQSNSALKHCQSEINVFQSKFEETSTGEFVYKQHALKLKTELEELYQKNEMIVERYQEEVNGYKHEIFSLRNELHVKETEKSSMSEALKAAVNENQSLKMEISRASARFSDDKTGMIREKRSLRKETQMGEWSETEKKIGKMWEELETAEREKFYIETEIRKVRLESNPLKYDSDHHQNLSEQLERYKRQISLLRNSIQGLQKNLESTEEKQKPFEMDREKLRKSMICTIDHSPHTCQYLHLSLNNLRNKSQFS